MHTVHALPDLRVAGDIWGTVCHLSIRCNNLLVGITRRIKNAKLSADELLSAGTRLVPEPEGSLMSWIILQTRMGPEEYQVSDLDEVVWWKTQNGLIAVGYIDAVSGLMSENDLETCRIKEPEIVHEILEQQEPLKPHDPHLKP
jgi:hypothetical protein